MLHIFATNYWDMNNVSTSFGSAIKSVRKSRGLSQDELGAMIGLNKSQISRIENGLCRSLTTIEEILSALNLSPVIELKPIRKELSLVEVLNVLRKFKAENSEKYGIEKIGLFGSYSRGEQTLDSDVDVCVLLDTPSYMTRAAIKDELETMLDREVDVISLSAKMDPDFKSNVLNDVIYV